MKIATLILAAGSSSRMGRTKQLLPWGNSTLLGNAVSTAHESGLEEVLVVLGAKANTIKATLDSMPCQFTVNSDWEEGLGSSIRTGVSHILSSASFPDGILIMLADQPFVNADYLKKLIYHFENGDGGIICSNYGKKLGVPAIFGRKYFTKLQGLGGDEGAGGIIKTHRGDSYSLDAGNIVMDLDTHEDYISLKSLNTQSDL
ncbi:MAG: nucleotidyltransferase family protein [Muriicola sp.]|nr:nucleotidyltransferase family protein [Muriicola sp.]NNK35046.1 nucleotidyltransferase family protein [Eudoraea sp.]